MNKSHRITILVAWGLLFAFALFHLVGAAIQTYFIATGDWEPTIDWSVAGGLKVAVVALRLLGLVALLAMLCRFLLNLRHDETTPFVRANVGLLFWSLLPWVVYNFCEANFHIISGVRHIAISTEMCFNSALLLAVAILYRRATLLAEENQLTI